MKQSLGGIFTRLLLVTVAILASVSLSFGNEANVMTSLDVDSSGPAPIVKISTEKPVGYRYTVYDSIDPVRIVLDFPGMDVDSILSLNEVDASPIERVEVSSFALTSGKLGRVEIMLESTANYDVALDGTDFQLVFAGAVVAEPAEPQPEAMVTEPEPDPTAEPVVAAEPEVLVEPEPEAMAEPEAAPMSSTASSIDAVVVNPTSVVLQADGHVEIFKFFTLGAPSRLVVDVYGVKAGFKQKKYAIGSDFTQMRTGSYNDKIRFVFDADSQVPDYAVTSGDNNVVVSWGDDAEAVAAAPVMAATGGPVNIEAVDFSVDNGMSVLRVTFDRAPMVIEPSQKGDIVGFGVKNATISRALRRAVDASSFPSSIRLVTPYTVLVGKQQDVRFAVELKGPSDYKLVEDGNVLLFQVENGPFAEPDPITTQVEVQVPDQPAVMADVAAEAAAQPEAASETATPEIAPASPGAEMATATDVVFDDVPVEPSALRGEQVKAYTGQRISLVFDNADIRNILQLIAEVSDLNILAGDGVEGTITLRLIDVPWDQALDLILDTKDLGMIRDGNVAKILPKEAIRSMDEAKFTAKRTQEKLEDLVTEVIKVSYTDLKNVSDPVKKILSERGNVTDDKRNKQLIVTDIQSIIDKVKELVVILDTPERQVLIEARIVEVSTTANLDLGVNWDIFYDQSPGLTTTNTIGEVGMGGNFVVPAFGAGTGQTAGFGTNFTWGQIGVNTTVLDLRLSALETAGEVKVVSNPRILALNGEKAKISQGSKIPYQTVSSSEIKTELVEAALILEVMPVINPDDSIILDIRAENSRPGSTVATGAGAAPQIDTKEAVTKMLVQNGETLVIGGIYTEQDDFSENGVPVLMHLPLLGNLFKSTKSNKNKAELMVFITPRIIE